MDLIELIVEEVAGFLALAWLIILSAQLMEATRESQNERDRLNRRIITLDAELSRYFREVDHARTQEYRAFFTQLEALEKHLDVRYKTTDNTLPKYVEKGD